jgi:hypothetical protein
MLEREVSMTCPQPSISVACAIDRIENPTEQFFRTNYVEPGKPVAIVTDRSIPQRGWNFTHLRENFGSTIVPVYDWGPGGPTIEDRFVIRYMKLDDVISHATTVRRPSEQRYSICQLPIESIPGLAQEYRTPPFLENVDQLDKLPLPFSEPHRRALFISFFRGIHFHNGREAVAQVLAGRKKFYLYPPKDSRFLYPRKFLDSPMAWFDETEAVFCSEIPFEKGLDAIDRQRFRKLDQAERYEVELGPGEALFIPSHWWHFTNAVEPCVVAVEFWDAPLRRWGYPIAWRSLIMKPYRKYLYRRVLRLKQFSRNENIANNK